MATVMSCGTGDWTGPLPGDPDNNSILSAVPAFGGIDVSWTYPNINPHAVAHVLLYRGISSNYAASVKQATVTGSTFYDRITGTAGTRYYYWIQIVSVNGTVGTVIGPASAIARSRIEDTIIDLSGKIEESALGTALRGSIGDITDNYNELTGSIAAFTGNNAAFMAALSGVQTGLTGALTLLNTEVTQRTSGQNALLSQQTVLAALNQVNVAAILEEQTVRVQADGALAQTVTDMGVANTSGIAAAVKTLGSSKIGYSGKATTEEPYEGNGTFIVYPVATYPTATFPDYAINRKRIIDKQGVTNWNAGNALQLVWVVGMPLAQAVKSIGISDGTDSLTVEQRATAQKLTNGTLLGKYTVKIDQGGRVAGYGLASSSNQKDGTTSAFAVNADTFSVSRPLSFSSTVIPTATLKGQTWFNENNNLIYKASVVGANEIKAGEWVLDIPRYPFIVDTVNGEVLIDNAVIRSLNSDSIDTRGLSIKDASGNVILSAGTSLSNQVAGVRAGGNMIPNSDLSAGSSGWAVTWNQNGGTGFTGPKIDVAAQDGQPGWDPAGGKAIGVGRVGTTGAASGVFDVSLIKFIPVVGGARYEFTGYLASHRCSVGILVLFYDNAGALLSETLFNRGFTFSNGGKDLANWERVGGFITVPANCAQIRFGLRGGAATSANAYYWGTRFFMAQAGVNQESSTPWSAGGSGGAFSEVDQITASNASTYIADASIGSAQIGSIALVGTSNFSVKTAASGARMEMDSRVIKVYDANGILRVQLGDLTI